MRAAIKDAVPLFLPAVPFGFILGSAMVDSAMPTWVGWLSNVVVFAGAAQFAFITLAGTVGWWTVVATAVVINSRHIMYSAALTPRFQRQPRWFRWFGAYLVIDQVFALVAERHDFDQRQFRRYLISVGLVFFVAWQLVVTVGVLLGSTVPEEWRLDFTVAVMFAGLVAMSIQRRSAAMAALVGAGAAVVLLDLPQRLGLLVAAAIGTAAGYLVDSLNGESCDHSTNNAASTP